MKKILVLSFAAAVFGLAACGSESADDVTAPDAATGETTPTEDAVVDSTTIENGSATDADGAPDYKDKTVAGTASSGESE